MNSRKAILWLTIVSFLIVLAILKFHESSRLYFEESIPVEFEITDTLLSHEEIGCGLAIFKISDSTVSSINSERLKFFENAIKARVFHKNGHNDYSAWSETPVPKGLGGERVWFTCGINKLVEDIVEAGNKMGSYYSTTVNGEAIFIVVPSLGVIAYSFWD